jgi:hypothetical protein
MRRCREVFVGIDMHRKLPEPDARNTDRQRLRSLLESAVWEAELSEKSGDGFDELEATVREEFAKFHE